MFKKNKSLIFRITIFSLLAILILINKDQLEKLYLNFFDQLPRIEKIVEKVDEKQFQEIKKKINIPPPLRAQKESPQSFLTNQGVVKFTNIQREKNGLTPLTENSLLSQAAKIKIEDMFEKQYFDHVSPEGLDVGKLAENTGYEFIIIGENLALGNFLNDDVLVQGWMDSPGHRDNILNSRYQEIGVAVLRGIYQGKTTWLAVQTFGMPLSACPQPNNNLKQEIDNNLAYLDSLLKELEEKKSELKITKPKQDPENNQKVEEYNRLVEEYNNLASETKKLIEQYNSQITAFNQCLD